MQLIKSLLGRTRRTDQPTDFEEDADVVTVTPKKIAVLSLLFESNWRINGKQRFQKLTFLLDEEYLGADASMYSWRKYDYGPYADQLETDLKELDSDGLVKIHRTATFGGNTRYKYHLTERGEQTLHEAIERREALNEVVELTQEVLTDHGDTPISNLINQVREDHPQYWENSVYIT